MPRKTLKRKYLELTVVDSIIGVQYAKNAKEIDGILEELVEDIDIIVSKRYMVPRYKVPKSKEWLTNILPNHDDEGFLHGLRVSRVEFNFILSLICDDKIFKSTTYRTPQMPVDTQLAVTLYKFGNYGSAASYGQVAGKFGLGDGGTVIYITQRVVSAILNLKRNYIFWPDVDERVNLANQMADFLQGCVGYVDGTHIPIAQRPSLFYADEYFSRKDKYGLHLQVICDHSKKIRHYVVGSTASVHDAKILNECGIGASPDTYFTNGQWLSGDGAYRLTKYLIVPFRRNSVEGSAEQRKKFNKFFSSIRIKIEHTFGVLKAKFASLKELRIKIDSAASHTFACQWIEACFILYNIVQIESDVDYFKLLQKMEEENEIETLEVDRLKGIEKRNSLVNFFMEHHY